MEVHFEVILRSITAFSILLIGARILGKQTISQMTLFDFIAAISIGSITANLAFNTNIRIPYLILAFIIFIFISFLIAYISMKNRKARKFLAGNPTIVIQNGKVLEENMRKMRYTIDYLNQQLREKDVFKIEEVLFALVEINGTLTVLKKPQYRLATKQDLHLQSSQESTLPIELIMDRKIIDENLKQNNLTIEWLQAELKKRNLQTRDVFYAVLSSNNNIFIDCYKDYITSPIDKE